MLLAGLRLGVRETVNFLMTEAPSFEEFEEWVLTKNGGAIEPARIARLNGALRGDGEFALETILPEPVLSPADLAFWDEHGYIRGQAGCGRVTHAGPRWRRSSLSRACRWNGPIPGIQRPSGFHWRTTPRYGRTGIRGASIPPSHKSGTATISGSTSMFAE